MAGSSYSGKDQKQIRSNIIIMLRAPKHHSTISVDNKPLHPDLIERWSPTNKHDSVVRAVKGVHFDTPGIRGREPRGSDSDQDIS